MTRADSGSTAGITWIRTLLGCPPQEGEEVAVIPGCLAVTLIYIFLLHIFFPDPIKLHELEEPHRYRPSSIKDLSSKTG